MKIKIAKPYYLFLIISFGLLNINSKKEKINRIYDSIITLYISGNSEKPIFNLKRKTDTIGFYSNVLHTIMENSNFIQTNCKMISLEWVFPDTLVSFINQRKVEKEFLALYLSCIDKLPSNFYILNSIKDLTVSNINPQNAKPKWKEYSTITGGTWITTIIPKDRLFNNYKYKMKPFGFSKEFSKLKSLEELSLTDEGYLLDASFLKGKFNQLLELDLSSDTIRNLNFDSCEFPKLKYLNINSQLKMNKVKHLIDLPNIKKIQINSLSASDTLCFKINDSSEVYLWLGEYQEPRDFTVNFCKIHPQHFKNVRFFDETAEIKTNGFFTSDLMVFGGDNNFMKFINLMGRWSDNKKDYILNTKEIILPSTIIIKEDYIKYFNGLNKIKFDFGHGIKKDLESMFNTAKLIRLQNKTVKFELAFLPDFNQMNETLQSNYREYSAKLKQL